MKPARRHVSIVTSGLGAGGAERVIALLAEHLVARGDRVSVISFDRPADRVYHPLPASVRTHRLGRGRFGVPMIEPLRRTVRLRRLLVAERPDVLISLLTKINAIALAATIGLRLPVIACERNNPEQQGAHPAWNIALALLYRRAAAIVCQTRDSVRCVPRRARVRAIVIPNPVARYPHVPGEGRPRRLVAVGRLTSQKGFDLLIAAFAQIADAHPEWRLDIWGEGEDRAALERQIEALGISQRIALRGLSDTPGGWLAAADALALSSRYEGFPNVLGEAMAAGLPVIATACDFGPTDLIDHGRTGLLAAPGDVDALASGIDQLLGDAALRARLGVAARSAMARYAPAKVLARWDMTLDEVDDRHIETLSSHCHLSAVADHH